MRIRKWWGLGAALLLAWGATQARAIDEEGEPGKRPVLRPTERPGLIDKLFDLGSSAPAKKPDSKASKKDAGDKANTAAAPAMTEQARQEAALLRRIDVCDKLRQIALETNNNELDQLAQELDARARAVYAQRTARLKTSAQATDLDEKILDRKLSI
ncbi:MAG TPA: hypothetical protein VGG61_04825, partial [Gemmataceae bacterium]